MRRGEVWWAQAPQGGRRPYLLLTRDAVIPVLHSLVTVPATRTVRGIPTEVHLDPDDGMPQVCALSVDNLTLMPKTLLTDRICHLGPHRMTEVCVALEVAVGC